jgi:hypothetical protein
MRVITVTMTMTPCDDSVGYGLATKLDVEGIRAGYTRRVSDAHGTMAIVDNVNIDIASSVATDTAGDVTIAGLGGINVNYTFLTDGDGSGYAICIENKLNKYCSVPNEYFTTLCQYMSAWGFLSKHQQSTCEISPLHSSTHKGQVHLST